MRKYNAFDADKYKLAKRSQAPTVFSDRLKTNISPQHV